MFSPSAPENLMPHPATVLPISLWFIRGGMLSFVLNKLLFPTLAVVGGGCINVSWPLGNGIVVASRDALNGLLQVW